MVIQGPRPLFLLRRKPESAIGVSAGGVVMIENLFMTTLFLRIASVFSTLAMAAAFSSCYYTEDPGPIQQMAKTYDISGFSRVEVGDAMNITIEKGDLFDISASGDRRNIDDLIVETRDNTLAIRFAENRNRRHDTHIRITMPALSGASFSGASISSISGFDEPEFDLYSSGASVCRLTADLVALKLIISGASDVRVGGSGSLLEAEVSGASVLRAFDLDVAFADLSMSGASAASVSVSEKLDAVVTGASAVIYRGNPEVNADVSGSSTVHRD